MMTGILGIVRRIAIVSAIVMFCGATTCTRPVGDILYAPGYGYVVKVERQGGLIDVTRSRDYYYIFPTLTRAEEFYHEYYLDPDGFQKTLQPGERVVDNDKGWEEFEKIRKLLGPPPPPPINDITIPLAVPDLPNPIPQTPQ